MTGRVWRGTIYALIGWALAVSASLVLASPGGARAPRGEHGNRPNPGSRNRISLPLTRAVPIPAPVVMAPPELDERRRDGHMTPEERKLLRQHIEDAARELYKR
jgi:hypothetical protein